MKKALFLLLSTLLVATGFAADTKPIESVFQNYWGAYAKKDFNKAAGDVLPADLEAAKAELLPVFLSAQSNNSKDVQQVVTNFFGRAVGKARESLSATDVFAGLNRVITASNPDFFEALKDASTTIIFVRTPDAESAEVHFQVTLRGESDIDMETMAKKNGRWWVRISEDPKEVAAQFKQMLAKQG